jgi:hypothetical protein
MVNRRTLASRVALLLVAAVAMVAFSGCSSSSPSAPANVEAGRVTGTVRSDNGEPIAEISIWLNAPGEADETDTTYQTTTDENGEYDLPNVEMTAGHSSECTYEFYANRTPSRTDPIDGDYTSWVASVAVPSGDAVVMDVELDYVGSDHDSYQDD